MSQSPNAFMHVQEYANSKPQEKITISIKKIQITPPGGRLGARCIIIISLAAWQLAGKWGYWGMRQRKWLVTYPSPPSPFLHSALVHHIVMQCRKCNLVPWKRSALQWSSQQVKCLGETAVQKSVNPGTAPDCDPPSPQNLHILVTVLIATGTVVVILTMISRLVSYLPKVLISAFPHPRSPG